jgi:hypothetical protein
MKSPKSIISRLKQTISTIVRATEQFHERFDQIKILHGIALSLLNENKKSRQIRDYEFQVFSQWGEDGIIQHLTKAIEIKNRTFIEFGVEDFSESNCRFLLMKDNWSGFVIDGSSKNIERLKRSYFYWKHHIDGISAFITKENINALLMKSGFEEDLGILSIDLDGNDYFILEAIKCFKPRILICEFNSVFGATRKISIPYEPEFIRTNKHYSNLYWGASLSAMTHIANQKGYSLVGTNQASNNAFYVRSDLLNSNIESLSVEQAYSPSLYRESRDEKGNFTYLAGEERLSAIKGLPIFNVEQNAIESI